MSLKTWLGFGSPYSKRSDEEIKASFLIEEAVTNLNLEQTVELDPNILERNRNGTTETENPSGTLGIGKNALRTARGRKTKTMGSSTNALL